MFRLLGCTEEVELKLIGRTEEVGLTLLGRTEEVGLTLLGRTEEVGLKLIETETTISSEFGRRAFSYCAPSVWNNLPLSIRSLGSFNSFKSHLKTHLFAHH